MRRLRRSTDPDFIASLLEDADPDLAESVVIGLGMYGRMEHSRDLAPLLHQPPLVSPRRVEDALWAIWMRAGSDWANNELALAMNEISGDQLMAAARRLQMITDVEPGFAEAHHQLGLVSFLLDRVDTASAAFQTTLALNPYHFAAASGLGHVAASQGKLRSAAEAYEASLRIHPTGEGTREALEEVQAVRRAYAARQSA
ncbi:MAG: hypothetical protein JNG88_11510 [Phycisphaerales bacterium]|nr:hypothetical protein [Phycisphaerales bacterium]